MANESKDKGKTAQAAKTATPEQSADPAHDSPKRQGDKLERARDAAAGKAGRK